MSTLFRNVSGQKVAFYFTDADGNGETGLTVTAKITKDWDTLTTGTSSNSPSELDSSNHPGVYTLELSQSETEADVILITPSASGAYAEPVIIYTQPKLFTFSKCSGSPTTTSIPTILTETTDDHYNGMFIMFLSGNCAGQSSKITDYDAATSTLTVDALTDAPISGDEFVIIGGTG